MNLQLHMENFNYCKVWQNVFPGKVILQSCNIIYYIWHIQKKTGTTWKTVCQSLSVKRHIVR